MKSKKLNKVFDDFTANMRKRLNQKEQEGFTGWDKQKDLFERAIVKLTDPNITKKDCVDVANFAMFIAYQINNRKGKK